jgi:hypothetical protein
MGSDGVYTDPMKKVSIKINVDADHNQWLREQAAYKRCSLSQVIRSFIVDEQRRQEAKVKASK